MDLQPEMRNLLMRNGLQAHVAFDGGGYRLIVQGHDSPLLVYPITERQMLALTDWGTNTANTKKRSTTPAHSTSSPLSMPTKTARLGLG